MQLEASVGKVIVEPIPVEGIEGFEIIESARLGEVKSMGPPMPEMWDTHSINEWNNNKVHPMPFTVGDKVLLPRIGTEYNGLQIFWQHDIPAWFK